MWWVFKSSAADRPLLNLVCLVSEVSAASSHQLLLLPAASLCCFLWGFIYITESFKMFIFIWMAMVKLWRSEAAQPDLLPNFSHLDVLTTDVFLSFTNKELLRLVLVLVLLYSLDFLFCRIQRQKQQFPSLLSFCWLFFALSFIILSLIRQKQAPTYKCCPQDVLISSISLNTVKVG